MSFSAELSKSPDNDLNIVPYFIIAGIKDIEVIYSGRIVNGFAGEVDRIKYAFFDIG